MIKTRHLLLILILSCFSFSAGAKAPDNTLITDIEQPELPIVLASLYDHWEKDLLPMESVRSSSGGYLDANISNPWVAKLGLILVLIAVGFIVVGDSFRQNLVNSDERNPDS